MALGLHNTFSEIVEAQKLAQIARLSSTEAGRQLLAYLKISSPIINQRECTLPSELRERLIVPPLPRNMHPQYNPGRRKARAAALLKTAAAMPDSVAFVDAAQYVKFKHFVAAVTSLQGEHLTSLTLPNTDADRAEQVAIALALATTDRTTVYTDSKAAAQAFRAGSVCKEAARVLSRATWADTKHLIWFPGHVGQDAHPLVPNANELAHSQARDLTRRAREEGGPRPKGEPWRRDPLLTYNEVCHHYRLERRKFPLPHPHLTRPQTLTLRLLQTGAYPSPNFYSRFISEIKPGCPRCGLPRCNLPHMLWQCPMLRAAAGSPATEEEWTALLTSPHEDDQLRAVQRAHDLATEFHLPVPSWTRPADEPP